MFCATYLAKVICVVQALVLCVGLTPHSIFIGLQVALP